MNRKERCGAFGPRRRRRRFLIRMVWSGACLRRASRPPRARRRRAPLHPRLFYNARPNEQPRANSGRPLLQRARNRRGAAAPRARGGDRQGDHRCRRSVHGRIARRRRGARARVAGAASSHPAAQHGQGGGDAARVRRGAGRGRDRAGCGSRIRSRRVSEADPADPRRTCRRRVRVALRGTSEARDAVLAPRGQHAAHVSVEHDDEPRSHRHGDLPQGLSPQRHPVDPHPLEPLRLRARDHGQGRATRRSRVRSANRVLRPRLLGREKDQLEGRLRRALDDLSLRPLPRPRKRAEDVHAVAPPRAPQALQQLGVGARAAVRRTARARGGRGQRDDDAFSVRPRADCRDRHGNGVRRSPAQRVSPSTRRRRRAFRPRVG